MGYQVCIPHRPLSSSTHLSIDMSAAKHADVLFVKQKGYGENDLAAYCNKEGIRHVLFPDFSHALPIVQAIVKGETTKEEVLQKGGL